MIGAFEVAYAAVHLESVGIKSKVPSAVDMVLRTADAPASPAAFADLTSAPRSLITNAGSVFPGNRGRAPGWK